MANTYFTTIALFLCGSASVMILARALIDVMVHQIAADDTDES